MAFTKMARFEADVLEIKGAPEQKRKASLDKLSDYGDFRTSDGYMYARIRAISSRVNKNNDGWPSIELAGGEDIFDQHTSSEGFTVEASKDRKRGFSTFVGKPIFVDHNNSDPQRARGVIVDAKFHVEDQKTSSLDPYYSSDNVDPEHLPASWVELLLEIDADRFPLLAKAIKEGSEDPDKGIDGFSMGCDVDHTICNICSNKATSPHEFCEHIRLKGATFDYRDSSSGTRTSKKSYENCYGIRFFEISAVFDPADETALLRELIHKEGAAPGQGVRGMRCPSCAGTGVTTDVTHNEPSNCPSCQGTGEIRVGPGDDGNFMLNQDQRNVGLEYHIDGPSWEGPMIQDEGGYGAMFGPNLTLSPEEIRRRNLGPVRQGSFMGAKLASKTADNPTPQSELTKAPEDVDTLRKEQVCPVCGADMDSGKCEVCGHETPPEGLNTPDLSKAHDFDVQEQVAESPAGQGEQSFLDARNPEHAASVTNEMRTWTPRVHPRLAGRINTEERPLKPVQTPATDEPQETVISDEPTPVTSSTRTAADLIADASITTNKLGNGMTDTNRTAAEPADPSGKPDARVNVEGVGGVYKGDNPEAQSKPDVRTDVEGKGGFMDDSNAEASEPDKRERVGDRQEENAGFQQGGQKGPPTKTWSENNGTRAVTDKVFSNTDHEAAAQGVKPIGGPDVQPQRREDLEQESGFTNPQKGTDQWTGTGGNKVQRQADPVTKKVDPNIDVKKSAITSHVVNVFKLADTEIELGITPAEKKYERVAELEAQDEGEISARLDTLSRVKTAGLTRQASKPELKPLPPLQRKASEEAEQTKTSKLDDSRYDLALFGV